MEERLKYSSLFGELTRQTQLRFDAVSSQHKLLFDKAFYERFFSWDYPTFGLNFQEIKGKYNVTIAATTIHDK